MNQTEVPTFKEPIVCSLLTNVLNLNNTLYSVLYFKVYKTAQRVQEPIIGSG